MREAVIVSTARTGLAKSWKGALNMTHGATMGGVVIKAAIERAGIDAAEVDDVLMGCANPEGATGQNIARQAALMAGCPVTTSGLTINRFCSSGLQTIAMAAQRVLAAPPAHVRGRQHLGSARGPPARWAEGRSRCWRPWARQARRAWGETRGTGLPDWRGGAGQGRW